MEIRNVVKATQWGYGLGADKVSMFSFVVPAEVLADKSEIFRRTPNRREGYQRELSDRRLGTGKTGVAGYLLKQMGVFPTSVLVNIRKEDGILRFKKKQRAHRKKGESNDFIEYGDLSIPDDVTWYVIDGQHRLEGLKIAMREKKEFANYPVFVTATNEPIFYEMLIFYIVNGRAKSVPTDLAYRILQRMLYDTKAPEWIRWTILRGADRRKAVAATIVDYMNFKEESPFHGRIQEVGEPDKPNHLTTDGTMTRYVSIILTSSTFSNMLDEEVADLLIEYWKAIKDTYPDCLKNPDDYMMMTTFGLSSLTRLFPTVHGYCARDGDVSIDNFRTYISYLLEPTPDHRDVDFRKPIDEQWWHKVNGPGIIHGTGEGLYKDVATKLGEKIGRAVRQKKRKK